MATSGSTSISVTSYNTLKFSWSESSQSIANNTTTINWKLELIAGSSGKISSTASKSWTVTVNGTKYSGANTVGISAGATKTLASGSTTIPHNANGAKTFAYSFSQEFAITFSGSYIGTKSGSGSGTLDTIPRASSLTASNGTLGTAQTLTISKADSSFTHTVTYKCGSASGTIASKTTDSSVSFTPPLSLASQNTTGTAVSIVFTLTTYSGSASIGTATKTVSCGIPTSVKPTASISVSDASGYAGTYGAYIQGKSKFTVSVTASGSYGSSIKAYKTTVDGSTYTAASFTTAVISGSGTITISTTVTDSRGRTATASTSISVIAYSPPVIDTVKVSRCTADGAESNSGAFLKVVFSASITSLAGNTAEYTVQYKKTSESAYTSEALTDYAGSFNVSDGAYIFPAATASTYNIILTASDAFSSAQKTAKGASVFKPWSVLWKGLGIAVGKIAELEGVFDIGFKTKFTGGIQNEVLEKITDLNDVLIPNIYVSVNKGATSYTNCPIASGTFVLEVMQAGAEGQTFQRLTTTFKEGRHEVYERHYFQSAWGSWVCVHSDSGWVDLTLQSGISEGSEIASLKGRLLNEVLYIKGDFVGVYENETCVALVPAVLLPAELTASTLFAGVYNASYFCGMNLTSSGQLYVLSNASGVWDGTKNISVNVAICR